MNTITEKALEWLKNNISPDMRIFEYGSGDLTLFLSETPIKELISIEHDYDQYRNIKQKLKSSPNKKKIRLEHIKPIIDKTPVPYSHLSFGSMNKSFLYHNFKDYVNFINRFPNESFDIILINGRSRTPCIQACIHKIKKGGYLILNNRERFEYSNAIDIFLNNFSSNDFSHNNQRTEIWEINC